MEAVVVAPEGFEFGFRSVGFVAPSTSAAVARAFEFSSLLTGSALGVVPFGPAGG